MCFSIGIGQREILYILMTMYTLEKYLILMLSQQKLGNTPGRRLQYNVVYTAVCNFFTHTNYNPTCGAPEIQYRRISITSLSTESIQNLITQGKARNLLSQARRCPLCMHHLV